MTTAQGGAQQDETQHRPPQLSSHMVRTNPTWRNGPGGQNMRKQAPVGGPVPVASVARRGDKAQLPADTLAFVRADIADLVVAGARQVSTRSARRCALDQALTG